MTPTSSMMQRRRAGAIGAAALMLLASLGLGLSGCNLNRHARTKGNTVAVTRNVPTEQQQQQLAEASNAKDAGNYDTALAMFQEILAENPTIATAHLGIGDIYIVKKDYEKAEPHYSLAAKLEPRNFDAQYGHGLALQMLNRLVEAVRAYHRALTIDPDSIKANLNLAITYLQMNEAQSAVTFAEKAVSLDPANGAARVNLGAAYEKVGRNKDAIDQYTAAMELVENTPPLMMNLINVLAAEKRYQEAANTAENLVKVEPSANAYERLGWCYFRLSLFDKSMDAYREAVKIDHNHWQSYNGIGVNAINTWLLSKKQNKDAAKEAQDAFRRSLRINPDQDKLITLMSNYGM